VPELPEVETVRRMLEPAMLGSRFRRVILNRPNLRIPFPRQFAERLRGTTVESVARRGKYLTVTLSSGDTLVMHLGMSGWFVVAATGDRTREPDPHDHVLFVMSSGQTVVFNDPRRFGFMDLTDGAGEAGGAGKAGAVYPALRRLGPEPLSSAFNAASLARACRGKKTSLKAALLDQRVVAGLGNIYASEALHDAKLSPLRQALTIATAAGAPRPPAKALAASIKRVLNNAIGRRESPYGSARFKVYDRAGEPCPRKGCTGTIRQVTQNGRSTFYCPKCQR
jgi:formamidopyrimidine-DNA glycosylase